MKNYKVYMHVFPNNKKYIGITCKKPNARWENGYGYTKEGQPAMYNAIQQYGWENIQHIILFEGLSLQEAQEKEKELIAYYHTNAHTENAQGYNLTDGGEGVYGHKCSEQARQKMSQAKMGKYKGDNCYKSKAVICDGKRYESITEFCAAYNLGRGMVEKWFRQLSNVPQEWIDMGLRLEGEECCFNPQQKPWNYYIEYDGQIFKSQAQFAQFIGVSPACVCRWIKNDKIPNYIKKKGFKRTKTFNLD